MYNVMHVVGDIDSMSALVSQLGAAVGKVWLQWRIPSHLPLQYHPELWPMLGQVYMVYIIIYN